MFQRTVGRLFYDGGHTYKDQYDGSELVLPFMASQSLIVVDDTNLFEEGINGSDAGSPLSTGLPSTQNGIFCSHFLSPRRDHGWHKGIQIIGRFRS